MRMRFRVRVSQVMCGVCPEWAVNGTLFAWTAVGSIDSKRRKNSKLTIHWKGLLKLTYIIRVRSLERNRGCVFGASFCSERLWSEPRFSPFTFSFVVRLQSDFSVHYLCWAVIGTRIIFEWKNISATLRNIFQVYEIDRCAIHYDYLYLHFHKKKNANRAAAELAQFDDKNVSANRLFAFEQAALCSATHVDVLHRFQFLYPFISNAIPRALPM